MMIKRRKILVLGSVVFLITAAVALKIFSGAVYQLPILMYHSIDYSADKSNKTVVSPEAFARQMKYLREHNYNVVGLDEAVSYINRKVPPPPKTIAITIDDGYEDNYRYAYPVLKQYNIPVTIFVIVGLTGKEGFLTWDQIKEMSDSGIVGIESHTMSHEWLTGIDDDSLKIELKSSKEALEKRLGKKIDYICYPMGGYNARVKDAVKKAGYKAAFATKPKQLAPDYDLYELKRVRISPTADNLFVFFIKISGYHNFFRALGNDHSKDEPYIIWKRKS